MQDRQRDLVAAQGALQRIAIDPLDQFAPADDQPRLYRAEQFVAAERDEIGAFVERLAHGRFVRESEAFADRSGRRCRGRPPTAELLARASSRAAVVSTSLVNPTMR